MPADAFRLTAEAIRADLDALAADDAHVAAAVALVGYPAERRRPAGFDTLLRIVVGQQLSTKAAASIYARLEQALDGQVAARPFLALADDRLRAVGFSRSKVAYARGLAEAVADGTLDLGGLAGLADDEAQAVLTRLKGVGPWSAQMYLMFSLGRPDVWPGDDLAVRAGLTRIKGLDQRPTARQTEALAEGWRPRRSAAALLCWHYYSNAPM